MRLLPPPCPLQRDDMEAVPGYLSLHQNADIMTLKWTPNQLMNGSVGDFDYERRCTLIWACCGFSCSSCSKCIGQRRLNSFVAGCADYECSDSSLI